jgi:uncharacterized repeat protein (TIGR01451 family)
MYTPITKSIFTALLLFMLGLANVSASQDTGPIRLSSTAEVEVEGTDASGEKTVTRVPATKVVPGKDVIYTLTFENTGELPGNDIVISNPIPDHTVYKSGSASGVDTDITFSVDGGTHFAPPAALTVRTDDGSVRPAGAADYTTIRFAFTRPLPPGEKSSVEFRVVLQ